MQFLICFQSFTEKIVFAIQSITELNWITFRLYHEIKVEQQFFAAFCRKKIPCVSLQPAKCIHVQLLYSAYTRVYAQVWFQNRRAKEKRLKKDAGRQRWSPYFRPMRPDRSQNDSDDRNSLDDQTNVQLDPFASKCVQSQSKTWISIAHKVTKNSPLTNLICASYCSFCVFQRLGRGRLTMEWVRVAGCSIIQDE